MSAEETIKIVLVGADEQEQAAFNNPPPMRDAMTQSPAQASQGTEAQSSRSADQPIRHEYLKPGEVEAELVKRTDALASEPERVQQTSRSASPPELPLGQPAPSKETTEQPQIIDSLDKLSRHIQALIDAQLSPNRNETAKSEARPQSESKHERSSDRQATKETGLTKLDSLKEDAAPVWSMVKQVIPREILEMGGWLRRMFEKHGGSKPTETSQEAPQTSVPRVPATPISPPAAAAGPMARAVGALAANPVTGPAVSMAAALTAGAVAVKLFADAATRGSDQLREYSADIQIVDAYTSMRRAQIDVARAREFGPQLAKVNAVKDQAYEAFEQLQWAIFKPMLAIAEKILPAIEDLAKGAELSKTTTDSMFETQRIMAAVLTRDQKMYDDAIKKLGELRDGKPKIDDPLGTIDPLMLDIMRKDLGGHRGQPMPPNLGGNFP